MLFPALHVIPHLTEARSPRITENQYQDLVSAATTPFIEPHQLHLAYRLSLIVPEIL